MKSVKVKILKPCKWNAEEFPKKAVGKEFILSAPCADDLCRAGKAVMVHDLDAMRKKVEAEPAEAEAKPKKKSSRKSSKKKSPKKPAPKKKSKKKKGGSHSTSKKKSARG